MQGYWNHSGPDGQLALARQDPAARWRVVPCSKILVAAASRLASASVQEWWLATTREKEDDLTADWGEALGLHVFRGQVDDVLSRFTGIITERKPDWIVRVTADDPFMDGAFLNRMLAEIPNMAAPR